MKKNLMAVCLAGSLSAFGFGQVGNALYLPGHTIKDQKIGLRAWGSGTVAESKDVALEGTTSIGIFSRNYFQGGIMTFGTPVNLAAAFDDPNALLQLTFRVADMKTVITPTVGAPRPGQPGQPPIGTPPGSGGRGGRGGRGGGLVMNVPGIGMQVGFQAPQGMPPGFFPPGQFGQPGGQPGAFPGQGTQAPQAPKAPLETLRLIVTTTDNLRSEFYLPVSSSFGTDRGWRSTAFPLSAITGFKRTNKIVKELSLSADNESFFYIGAIRIVSDSTPITGEVDFKTLNLAQGDKVVLKARGYAGSTLLKYEWNFDDHGGPQVVDATGPTVTRIFSKPGNYKVTVTVRDFYKQKTPVTKSIDVTVNP